MSRAAADLLDAILVCIGSAVAALTLAMLRALFAGPAFELPRPGAVLAAGGISILFVGYLTFFWTTTGRTPGKQASGLRVVTSRGEALGIVRAAARAVVCLVFPVGLLWAMVSPTNRAVHDVLLGTAVVYDWRRRAAAHGSTPSVRSRPERVA